MAMAVSDFGTIRKARGAGFTLIEMSIVLVIIGLIIGGVLVGRDLINAAAIRSQISQIEKYNAAVNTFRGKYGYLPGDIPDPTATQYGFVTRGPNAGMGDGNGVIEGNYAGGVGANSGLAEESGETVVFWVDLSTATLIDGGFTTAIENNAGNPNITGTGINAYLPHAKLGSSNYIYVWSGGINGGDGNNYFGLSGVASLNAWLFCTLKCDSITAAQAYTIDSKVDDGLPQTGRVMAVVLNHAADWAGGVGGYNGVVPGGRTAGDTTTCYDNGNVNGAPMTYSTEISNGVNVTCALSFKFQ